MFRKETGRLPLVSHGERTYERSPLMGCECANRGFTFIFINSNHSNGQDCFGDFRVPCAKQAQSTSVTSESRAGKIHGDRQRCFFCLFGLFCFSSPIGSRPNLRLNFIKKKKKKSLSFGLLAEPFMHATHNVS